MGWPRAARELVSALSGETGLPIHCHTHDISGVGAASILPALEWSDRDAGIDRGAIQWFSHIREGVRQLHWLFESAIRADTSGVYRHEMPGGQYTNLREQARSLGLENRWPKVPERHAEVNLTSGDIAKVTPTSKVVGDMLLFMVANDLSVDDVMDTSREVSVPESVVSLFRGDLGLPPRGFPEPISRRVLKFIYWMSELEEVSIDIDPGKSLVVRLLGAAPADQEGVVKAYFELNGQPRTIRVERNGVIDAVLEKAGETITAHDLLVVMRA